MLTTDRLFAAAWLASLSADTPRERALDTAQPVIDAALGHIDEALATLRADIAALAATGAPTHITPLLRAETAALPGAAQAADNAVHDLMQRIAFKRRELLPLFPPLLGRIRSAHEEAARHCGVARWHLMAIRALADPGGPSSPIHGGGTRYVKSDRFDTRAAQSLPAADRIRADRALKRLGESPVPAELDLRPLDGGDGLWTMKAGSGNRFLLRTDRDRRGDLFVVEDVGPWGGAEAA